MLSVTTALHMLHYRKFNTSYAVDFFPIKTKMDYTIYLDFAKGK